MAIDMPPPMPPMPMTEIRYEAISKSHGAYFLSGHINGATINIFDLPYISKEDAQVLLNASNSPSHFILNLNTAYYLKGHLLVQIAYRQVDKTVFIYAVQSRLVNIQGPGKVTKYFNALKGDKNLTISEVDKRKVMADISSNRQGLDYSFTYQPSADYAATDLILSDKKRDVNRIQVDAELGNEGNRYVGSYLAKAGIRTWQDSGSEFKASYIRAIPRAEEKKEGNSYHALVLNYNFPSPKGLYGIEFLTSEYSRLITETIENPNFFGQCQPELTGLCNSILPASSENVLYDISAKTTKFAGTGEQILYSRPGRRVIVNQKLEGISDEIEDFQQGVILDESYGVVGLGVKYVIGTATPEKKKLGQFQLQLSKGFGGNSGTLDAEDAPEGLNPGNRSAEFLIIKPSINAQFTIYKDLSVILSGDAQISDNVQLPQFQQYTLGGMSQLSAFLPGVLVGDSGTYGRMEFVISPSGDSVFKIIPSIFIETGETSSENTSKDLAQKKSISDAGARVIITIGKNFQLEVSSATVLKYDNLSESHIDEYKMDFFAKAKLLF
jgi:hypothetical protein